VVAIVVQSNRAAITLLEPVLGPSRALLRRLGMRATINQQKEELLLFVAVKQQRGRPWRQ